MTPEIIYMIGFLIIAHTVESILGFGATIIALALGAHFFPVNQLVVILVLLALLQSTFLLIRWFKYIQWAQVLKFVIPIALVGVLAGIGIRNYTNESLLKLILGIFVIILSAIELFIILFRRDSSGRGLSRIAGFFLILSGGLFHGLLASGGPPIVYYSSRKLSSQESVRGTLAFIWILLNIAMVAGFLINNRFTVDIFMTTGMLLPGVIIGIIIGQILKVSDHTFKVVTYILLCIIGITLILPK